MPDTLKNPASDLATALGGQTLGNVALVLGRNVFAKEIPPTNTMAVFLLNSGGEAPEPYCGTALQSLFRSNVVMYVRGVPGVTGYTDSETLARAVLGFLHLRTVSGYVSVRAQHPHPDFEGHDELERPRWTATLVTTYTA